MRRKLILIIFLFITTKTTTPQHLLGCDLGGSEDQFFWLAFQRSLVKRGLNGLSWS